MSKPRGKIYQSQQMEQWITKELETTELGRYIGTRKNLFDLRRTAVVHNLHVLAKIFTYATEQSATLS
ncbi:hypothetical protein [Nostoc sp.]|uniref:hypothetical protein n=1 Tax=Nostoc sp. TaxID=1180 RepID=UPI002FFC2411